MNLDEIDDINQLNELYVECHQNMVAGQEQAKVNEQNLTNIRIRITQIKRATDEALKKSTDAKNS